MSVPKNAIVINAYPNNPEKMDMLDRGVSSFKKLGIPIVVISGCDIDPHIVKNIDYLIINREKFVLPKQYMRWCNTMCDFNNDVCCTYFHVPGKIIFAYNSNHNVTIARNMKLVFSFLKSIGVESAFYTEDDNIFHEPSFDVIRENLRLLNEGSIKMACAWGTMESGQNMIFTCMFFTNVDFFLKHFELPTLIEGWYDLNNLIKYNLHRAYEESFYKSFEHVRDQAKNIIDEYRQWIYDDRFVTMNLNRRYDNMSWRLDHNFNVYEDMWTKEIHFFAYNMCSPTMPNKDIHVLVEENGSVRINKIMNEDNWHYFPVRNDSVLKVTLDGKYTKTINVSDIESIRDNGFTTADNI